MKSSFLLLVLHTFVVLPGNVLASYLVSHTDQGFEARATRHLSPVLTPDTLGDRSSGTELLKREASFDYLDAEAIKRDGSIFVTKLTVGGQLPILALEDLEADLEKVSCSDSEIDLLFASPGRLEEVRRELEDAVPFVAITSHVDCNNDDERAPHW